MNKEIDQKRFPEWITLKEKLHNVNRLPDIKDGEIWWCAMGENVGVEINGKNREFSRPVLVFKKLSRYGFMGIPLTSQKHIGTWYISFVFQDKEETAVLAQAKVISVSGLYKRMGAIADPDFDLVRKSFKKLYLK